jgi:hypothetical protein
VCQSGQSERRGTLAKIGRLLRWALMEADSCARRRLTVYLERYLRFRSRLSFGLLNPPEQRHVESGAGVRSGCRPATVEHRGRRIAGDGPT